MSSAMLFALFVIQPSVHTTDRPPARPSRFSFQSYTHRYSVFDKKNGNQNKNAQPQMVEHLTLASLLLSLTAFVFR